MKEGSVNEWEEYYMEKKGGSWGRDLVNKVNQAVPRFTEVFDEDTFYVTAVLVVCATFVAAFVASRYVRIKPHNL